MSEIIQATGDLFPTITGMPSDKGVAMNPPPDAILGEVTRMVESAMASVPENGHGALVGIATKDPDGSVNVNLVLAVKASGHVNLIAFAGKRWGSPVSGGAAIQVHF